MAAWNRFDVGAQRFKRYLDGPDDKQMSRIHDLAVDPSGKGLWIATVRGGLAYLDTEDDTLIRYRHDSEDPRSIASDRLGALLIDSERRLWVGTQDHGLSVKLPGVEGFTHFRHEPEQPSSLSADKVWVIFEDQDGTVWVGTESGLNTFNSETGSFERFDGDPADATSLSYGRIASMYQDRGGVLWVGTHLGLNLWNPNTGSFRHFPPNRAAPNDLSGSFVTSFTEDRSGKVWIGSYGGGISVLDPSTDNFTDHHATSESLGSLSSDNVTSLFADDRGSVWVGTFEAGLNRYDPVTGRFEHFRHDPADGSSLSFDGVTSLLEDSYGDFWVGTYRGGLNRLNRDTGRFEHFRFDEADVSGLRTDAVVSLYEDRSGTLWIGTDGGGLSRFDRSSSTFVTYLNDPDDGLSLSSDNAWSVLEDRLGNLWVGTQGGGLSYWSAEDRAEDRVRFRRITKADGLASDISHGLVEDDLGQLWISSNRGMSRLDTRTLEARTFDTSNGLQSDEFMFGANFRTADGEIYFGGVNGFNTFYPQDIQDNSHVPPVQITEVWKANERIADRDVASLREIALNHRDYFRDLSSSRLFDFAAPKKNQYSYMLEGFDPDWVDLGTRRRATYTNLNPGEYTFKVRAANNDGLWNEGGDKLHVRILPPPWRTALGLCSLWSLHHRWRLFLLPWPDQQASPRARADEGQRRSGARSGATPGQGAGARTRNRAGRRPISTRSRSSCWCSIPKAAFDSPTRRCGNCWGSAKRRSRASISARTSSTKTIGSISSANSCRPGMARRWKLSW